jgi:hypothetical protein
VTAAPGGVVGRESESPSSRGPIRDSSSRRRFGFDALVVAIEKEIEVATQGHKAGGVG